MRTVKSFLVCKKVEGHAAIRGKHPMREYYDHLLAQGMAEHHARNAVARQIARTSYGMLKNGTRYEPYRWKGLAREAM